MESESADFVNGLLKRNALATTAAAALVIAGAGVALAAAHFMSAAGSVLDSGALNVAFDEAGLGNQNVTYTLTANGSATYACVNNGENHPQAQNKQTVSASVQGGGTFQAKNGRVQASVQAGPPSAGGFSCSSGQTLVLACASYTNTVLTDTTNNVSISQADMSGTFKRTLFAVRKLSCP